MSDLVLDIGSEKILLSEVQDGQLSKPTYFARPKDAPGLTWIVSTLSAWPGEIDTVVAAASGLVSGGRLYSERLGNIDFLDLMKSQFNADSLLINDGHAAALATDRKAPTLAVHLGSGVALGYIDEELFRGASGFAGEASRQLGGIYLEKLYRDRAGGPLSNEKIFVAAREDIAGAREVVLEFSRELALEIKRASYLFDPARLVFSGGGFFEDLRPWLFDAFAKEMEGEELWQEVLSERQIEVSPLGANAPLIGAASLIIPDAVL